ncbi:5583_t:CDS:2 [Funneliformis mosseae]|uniref:5583_t:CDS:1 n=1 Tax=Funneliformis mosseae TaxID=27381 RepID=A0A9N8VPB0_FUNMO|nr:5583_t:CDS:2 [Funneliformis mosseae]
MSGDQMISGPFHNRGVNVFENCMSKETCQASNHNFLTPSFGGYEFLFLNAGTEYIFLYFIFPYFDSTYFAV